MLAAKQLISHRTLKKLFACCILLFAFSAQAQTWEAGIFAGGSGYMGDLNQHNPVKPSGLAVGAFVQRNISPYLSVKLNYTFGRITAADSTSGTEQFRARNLSFTTKLNEIAVIGEFNFMKFTPGADFNHFTPYLFLGAGVVDYNPQATYKGTDYNLRPLQTEGAAYPNFALVIPYGIGFKYNFSSAWNLGANIGYRYARTDYLDDVSGYYADKTTFSTSVAKALSDRSGENTGNYIGVAGTQRGDFRTHDTYLFIGFTLSFTFVTTNCYY